MVDYRNSHIGTGRGKIYDEKYKIGAENFSWHRFEIPFLTGLFKKLSKNKSQRFLDFAVGTGRILEIAFHQFPVVVGVDVSPDMLVEAEKKVPSAKLIQSDVTKDNIDIGTFDVITCFRFILNAEPELSEKVLIWLRKTITESGVLIINNHLNSSSITGIVCRLSNFIKRKNNHNILSDHQVKELLHRCGFHIKDQYGFCIIPAWRNQQWLPSWLWYFVEKMFEKTILLRRFGKDQIYICTPTNPNHNND